MSTKDEIESAVIRCPRRGECYAVAGTASTQVFAAPASWRGKKVRFEAAGDKFWLQVHSAAAIVIVPAERQTIAAGALTGTNTGTGEPLADGQYKELDFVEADAFVGFIGTGTAGVLYFRETETALGNA